MYGFWRDDGLPSTASLLILAISFWRDVAWRAFALLAEKRCTNSCSSPMRSLARALAAIWRARAWVDASM